MIPAPSYPDAATRALVERLEDARRRRGQLRDSGRVTADVDREIADLRGRLREGGQLRAGDSLGDGRHLLLERIGGGGPTSVWRAHDREAGQLVAIRVLRPDLAGDPARRERFFRGARVTGELPSEAVVPVIEPEAVDHGVFYFVMRLIPGGDLRRAVLVGRLPPGGVLARILRIGDALATAHFRGIVHLDVKPANILLDEALDPWLTDFDLVSTGELVASAYTAPEVLARTGSAEPSADVYGLGMTAIFGLHGRELPAPVAPHAAGIVDGLACEPAIKSVLRRAIDARPEHRYRDAARFSEALRDALAVAVIRPAPIVPETAAPAAGAPGGSIHTEDLTALEEAEILWQAGDLDAAMAAYEAIVAADPANDRAARGLERIYRRTLHLVAGTGDNDLEHRLWHALGMVYRDCLHERSAAIEAFRMASRLAPLDAQGHRILAELFEAGGQPDDAIVEYRVVIEIDPLEIDPYRRLYHLAIDKQSHDQAWCFAAALAFMREADQDESRFFEDHRPRGVPAVRGRLDNEQWIRNLFHHEESLYVGKIFEMIAAAALRARIDTLRARKELPVLDPRFRQDPATSTATLPRTFGWAAQVLGVPRPLLYVRSDVPGALVAVASEQPASVAGKSMLTGFSAQELLFIVGKHLAMYRGEHYLTALFPTVTELTVLFFAGVELVAPDAPSPPDLARQIAATATTLRRYIQPAQLEGLRMVVKKFLAEGARLDLARWVQTVALTANRAGLLLCGDLEIAGKILAAEPQQPGDLSAQERLEELLRFSVSLRYQALRAALGIQIAVGG